MLAVIKSPEALNALVVAVKLGVELVEVGDAGKDDPHPRVRLAVQLLKCGELKFLIQG